MKLIATKAYSYNTRRLRAGDEFEANDYHARVLVGARRARYAPDQPIEPPAPPPPPPLPPPAILPDEIEEMRAQAERLGVAVDGRWGRARLQYEIDAAQRK